MNRSFLALLTAVSLVGCSKPEVKEEKKEGFKLSDTMMQQIVLDTVRERPIQDELVLTGEIQADGDKTVQVFPLVGGVVEKLNVQLGDKVTKGQVLGLLGNTGNSDAPHLHFHLMDSPVPLYANGLPFVLERFTSEGVLGGGGIDDLFDAKPATIEPRLKGEKRERLPLNNEVIDFGE